MTLLDASVIFGVVERHEPRTRLSQNLVRRAPRPLFTTEACIAEAMYLAESRVGWRAQEEIWELVAVTNLVLTHADVELTERLMRRYRDVPMDFADTTLVALASEDPRVRVATFDSDFLAYRRDDGTPIPLVDDRLLGWS